MAMSRSPVGHSMHEIVQARAARDTDFVGALLQEAGELLLGGEPPAARSLIRDAIKGSMGYADLSRRTGTPEKSLVRMFGPSGNPTAANLASVLCELQRHGRLRLRVRSEPLPAATPPRRSATASRR
jgi:DNA-binding phage protein